MEGVSAVKFAPYDYQKYCIGRMITDNTLGLFLDMGLGKTVITLSAVNDLKYNRFQVSKVLVIAPKRVAERTWMDEAVKWDHLKHLRVIPVLGSEKKRVAALNTPGDIYVINRENVSWLVEHDRNAWRFDMVVIDELSSFKNHKAKRFKSLTWVRGRIKRIVGLTGTPAPNGLMDLWAEVYLLDEGARLGKRITHFRERYFSPDKRSRTVVYSYAPKDGADQVIRGLIGDICISMKSEDYLQLPECITIDIPVYLDSKAKRDYETLERDMLLQVDDETIDAGSAAVLTNKLLQLCNGALYNDRHEVAYVHDCKLEVFTELVEGLNGHPALVFYSFQHDIERITKALDKAKLNLRVRVLKTAQDAADWNAGEIDILLAHPASCAYGLNLQQGGNHIIWFGLNWSLELYQQANKRLHRQGQREKVIIHRLLVSGGVDEDVAHALEDKGQTQDALIEALKARIEKIREASVAGVSK